jgi:hypothetical protein
MRGQALIMTLAKQFFVSSDIRPPPGYLPKSCHRRCIDPVFPSFVLLDDITEAVLAAVLEPALGPTTAPELALAPPLPVVLVLVRGKADGWEGRSSTGGKRSLSISDLRLQKNHVKFRQTCRGERR